MKDLTSEKQGRSSTIQDKSGKCLAEEKETLSRWTESCSELYSYESCGDNAVLDCSQPPEEDLQPILREEVKIAAASLKKGKSAGVDNIPVASYYTVKPAEIFYSVCPKREYKG